MDSSIVSHFCPKDLIHPHFVDKIVDFSAITMTFVPDIEIKLRLWNETVS